MTELHYWVTRPLQTVVFLLVFDTRRCYCVPWCVKESSQTRTWYNDMNYISKWFEMNEHLFSFSSITLIVCQNYAVCNIQKIKQPYFIWHNAFFLHWKPKFSVWKVQLNIMKVIRNDTMAPMRRIHQPCSYHITPHCIDIHRTCIVWNHHLTAWTYRNCTKFTSTKFFKFH